MVGGSVAFIGLSLGILACLPPHNNVLKANFDCTELGMTKDQVEKIFGPPATRFPDPDGWAFWESSDGSGVLIEFEKDCVVRKDFKMHDVPVLERILALLPKSLR